MPQQSPANGNESPFVILRNRRSQSLSIVLDHDAYCARAGECRCEEREIATVAQHALSGKRVPRTSMQRVPSSITVAAGESVRARREILQLPQVQNAIGSRWLAVR